MSRDDIVKMAREAGMHLDDLYLYTSDLGAHVDAMARFAALVAAHEREECAKVCDRYEAEHWRGYKSNDPSERANPHTEGLSDGAGECAASIRARGTT